MLWWVVRHTGHSRVRFFARLFRHGEQTVWPQGMTRGLISELYCSKHTGHSKLRSIYYFLSLDWNFGEGRYDEDNFLYIRIGWKWLKFIMICFLVMFCVLVLGFRLVEVMILYKTKVDKSEKMIFNWKGNDLL